jgi:hypothetical protein
MIKYDLKCAMSHSFEGWFASSTDYEQQVKEGLLSCPICGDLSIERAIVAPAIKKSSLKKDLKKLNIPNADDIGLKTKIRSLTKEVEKYTIDVGDNFAEEATMIYNGKKKSRPIRGTATKKEERKLKKEGVPYIKLPLIKDN